VFIDLGLPTNAIDQPQLVGKEQLEISVQKPPLEGSSCTERITGNGLITPCALSLGFFGSVSVLVRSVTAHYENCFLFIDF